MNTNNFFHINFSSLRENKAYISAWHNNFDEQLQTKLSAVPVIIKGYFMFSHLFLLETTENRCKKARCVPMPRARLSAKAPVHQNFIHSVQNPHQNQVPNVNKLSNNF